MLSAGLVAAAASVAGLATFATFTDSTTASQSITSGTIDVTLGAAGSADNRLTIGASDIAAGDTIERQVKLSNPAGLAWGSASLTTTAAPTSLLDSDVTNGLQMVIDKCSVAWTESAAPYTYSCSGTTTSVLASGPVIGANRSLGPISALTPGGSDYLRVKLTLPTTADNTFQGLSSTLQYSFNATQRTGTSK